MSDFVSSPKSRSESSAGVVNADSVITEEMKRLRLRRELAGVEKGDPQQEAVGLALSGGGIRSATFSLGVLQALQRYGVFNKVDYLSTVSGGGFIGSCLTWFMTANNQKFPFGERRADFKRASIAIDEDGAPVRGELVTEDSVRTPGDVVSRLRQHGEYLAPHPPLNIWAFAAGILRGAFISLLAFLPLLFLLAWILHNGFHLAGNIGFLHVVPGVRWPLGFGILTAVGLLCWVLWLSSCVAYALRSSIPRSPTKRQLVDGWHGRFLLWGFLFLLVGLLPVVHDLLSRHLVWSEVLASITGLIVMRLSRVGRNGDEDVRGYTGLFLHGGLLLAVYGLFLGIYRVVALDWITLDLTPGGMGALALLAAPVLLLWVFADINQISMLRFYRDRIVHAFLPANPGGLSEAEQKDPYDCRLSDLEQTAAPYPIINTNLVTINSPDTTRRLRCGENFILSPLYCGSVATKYLESAKYLRGTMDLATACAISGAAVAANTRFLRARTVSFLMTIFNVSLGFWSRNPAAASARDRDLARGGADYFDVFLEMLGFGLHEGADRIHLTDGGHFENLGAYELIRRRCAIIIICDAGADPDWKFADLSNLVQKVRVDFGASIEIDTRPLRPKGESRLSEEPFVIGKVHYSGSCTDGGPESGVIIYLKTCVIAGLPEDIYGYRRSDPAFPDTPTSNQFFGEARFEAYRELGYRLAEYTFKEGIPRPHQESVGLRRQTPGT